MKYYTTEKTLANGYTVKICYDDDPISPREWDNAGTVTLLQGLRYNFGDDTESGEAIREIMENPQNLVLPIYLYDHSGITINTTGFSCRWDSGQAGVIYMTKAKAVQEWGKKICTKAVKEKALACMRAEIKELDQYITGTVYAYEIYDREGEFCDSCHGFYGEESYCFSEGEAAANYLSEAEDKKAAKETAEALYWAERDVMTA